MQKKQKLRSRCHAKHVAVLVLGFLLLHVLAVEAQQANQPFSDGEAALYGAYYNWHFIWMNAGEVTFTSNLIQYKNKPAWNFKAIGKTYKTYDLLYTVRDTFESVVAYPAFEPLWFRRVVNHGHGHSMHQYDFHAGEGVINSKIQRGDEPLVASRLTYKPGVFDLLSTAYHFRDFNFDQMKLGQKVNFTMLVDNKVEDLYFRYQGTEEIKTRNGRKFRCHKVSVWLLEGDFFPEGEYMKVWFTADKNRLPIMVETKILIGTVKAVFLDAKQLKYPLTSEISK